MALIFFDSNTSADNRELYKSTSLGHITNQFPLTTTAILFQASLLSYQSLSDNELLSARVTRRRPPPWSPDPEPSLHDSFKSIASKTNTTLFSPSSNSPFALRILPQLCTDAETTAATAVTTTASGQRRQPTVSTAWRHRLQQPRYFQQHPRTIHVSRYLLR